MGLPQKKTSGLTYADYLNWTQDERFELIEGAPFSLGPAPLRRHQIVVGELFRQIANRFKSHPCQVYIAPFDVRLPRHDQSDAQTDTVLQPDISIVCDPSKLDERGCRGAPDWVIEVISPSTASRDQLLKRRIYEAAGVREYWLVHPADRLAFVYGLEQGSYGKPHISELSGILASRILPEVEIDWSQLPQEALNSLN